ncbi:MAG: Amuc_1100 family pilus-like protein, partial [Verrucomicrobiota bacterium]
MFGVVLGGGTVVAAVAIFLAGSKESTRYSQAKEEFAASAAEASAFESLALYPRAENCDGKRKALVEYRQATETLQAAFAKYRPQQLTNVSPQDFTTHLKAVNDELRKALTDGGAQVPDPFFCGFENYQTSLARGNATGILNYQLDGIKTLLLTLAKTGPSQLLNFYRPPLAEEDGRDFAPQATDVARPLPLEITFIGPEQTMRAFLSEIIKLPAHYVVIRSLAVTNAKKDPPRAADAKFDKPAAAAHAAGDVFGGGFVLPNDEPKPAAKKSAAAPP